MFWSVIPYPRLDVNNSLIEWDIIKSLLQDLSLVASLWKQSSPYIHTTAIPFYKKWMTVILIHFCYINFTQIIFTYIFYFLYKKIKKLYKYSYVSINVLYTKEYDFSKKNKGYQGVGTGEYV
jgi:hypothetical protein